MNPQLCVFVNYLYRRHRMPGSIRWHMNAFRMPGAPEVRLPGFVEQEGNAEQLGITLAVPCSANWEIESETQKVYEDLADEHFRQLRSGQELA